MAVPPMVTNYVNFLLIISLEIRKPKTEIRKQLKPLAHILYVYVFLTKLYSLTPENDFIKQTVTAHESLYLPRPH